MGTITWELDVHDRGASTVLDAELLVNTPLYFVFVLAYILLRCDKMLAK